MAAKKQRPGSEATGQGSKCTRLRQSKAGTTNPASKMLNRASSEALLYADHRRSGLTKADCKKLLRAVAPEAEIRKVMRLSSFVPNAPRAYRIAIFGPSGRATKHVRYKLLDEKFDGRGKRRKYHQKRGSGCYAHFSPLLPGGWRKALDNKKRHLYFIEGEKKGDKACKHGLAAIAFPGVNNFVVKDTGEFIPEIDALDLTDRVAIIVFDSDAKTNMRVMNARNDLARRLMRKGAIVFWVELPEGENGEKRGLDDFLVQENKTAFMNLQVERLTEEDVTVDSHRHLTDVGNANRLVDLLQDRAIYVPEAGAWYFYNGLCWQQDRAGRIVQEAKAAARAIFKEAAAEDNGERREKISKHALKTESESGIKSMIALSCTDPRVVVSQCELDGDPNLLCVANAMLDLRSGKPVPADPGHYITQQANAEYHPKAKSPNWDNFLETTLPDHKVATYLKRAFGYSLTGQTGEQVLFFPFGNGQNGKSAVVETFAYVLGDYAASAPSSMLMKTHNDAIPNDVAALRARRFVALSESDTGDRLNESKVKQYTGGDAVPARFLHREWFTFTPNFKLWIHGNHKPIIRGQDWAIWRRMGIIPFEVQIPDKDRVLDFAKKHLYPEASGILNWAIQGCLEWQKKGLAAPQRIKSEVATYREESDVLAEFVAECCETDKNYGATSRELFQSYAAFCELGKERPSSSTLFGRMMTERFNKVRTAKGVSYRGLRLKEGRKRKVRDRGY